MIQRAFFSSIVTAVFAAVLLLQPWRTVIDVGGLYDSPFVRDMHGAEYSATHGVNFRWSRSTSTVVVPGAGQPTIVALTLHGNSAGTPVTLADGLHQIRVPLRAGWQHIALMPRAAFWSGTITLSITAPTQTTPDDPRERGVAIRQIVAIGQPGVPPPMHVLVVGCIGAIATLLATWIWHQHRQKTTLIAAVLLCFVGGMAWALTAHGGAWRLYLTVYSTRLLLALVLTVLIALLCNTLVPLLMRASFMPHSPRHTAQYARALATIAAASFLLRFVGMSYPLNFISDIRFTMARATMVREGHFLELFLPNPSLTPVQWETEATIPRSPFYYVLAAPLTALPGEWARVAVMALSSAIDALSLLCVAAIVLSAGGGRRSALSAAAVAAVLPLGLMAAMSWGLFPTLLAQALMLVAMVVWLALSPRLHNQPHARWIFATTMTIAYIAYPTGLLFFGTTWALLLLLLAVTRHRATHATCWSGIIAILLAFLLYYGWHVPAMLTRTLPDLAARVYTSDGANDTAPLVINGWQLLDAIWFRLDKHYGILTMTLASMGIAIAINNLFKPTRQRAHTTTLMLIAWSLTYVPMAFANRYVVTFILKDALYLLPAVAVGIGLLLGKYAQRRYGLVIMVVIVAYSMWQGISFELDAIVHAFHELK